MPKMLFNILANRNRISELIQKAPIPSIKPISVDLPLPLLRFLLHLHFAFLKVDLGLDLRPRPSPSEFLEPVFGENVLAAVKRPVALPEALLGQLALEVGVEARPAPLLLDVPRRLLQA
eukprot:CAMPEP_0168329074 /NCGR_PEP_ID=MMETSP0213-20121227/6888_1 /TAXON_ID=151035 /ORGANISM="Euplotes harpa, Strain FSP1.4" /LENGTH=118 /DNA_ID=CAMNT_0008332323 /DNA_START=18 /DNA_END=374 /DNA_ORIENTATION=-